MTQMAAPGHELIVGMRRDPQFGPLLMFGLGGIYVELLKDVAFRVAPFGRRETLAMIDETHAGKLLHGLRGQPASDIDAVAEIIERYRHKAAGALPDRAARRAYLRDLAAFLDGPEVHEDLAAGHLDGALAGARDLLRKHSGA